MPTKTGVMTIRLDVETYNRCSDAAHKARLSLNQWAKQALVSKIMETESPDFTPEKMEGETRLTTNLPVGLMETIQRVKANTYLDDDVINRHQHTTTECHSLKELFSYLPNQ